MTTNGRGPYNIWHPTIDATDATVTAEQVAAAPCCSMTRCAQDIAWMVLGGAR